MGSRRKLLTATQLLVVLGLLAGRHRADGDCEVASLTTVSGRSAPEGRICPNQLVFVDHFYRLNDSTWSRKQSLPRSGFEWMTDSARNSYVRSGLLVLQPTLSSDVLPDNTDCNIQLPNCTFGASLCKHRCSADNIAPPVQTARLDTEGGFAFRYGRLEIRAKLPTGDWLRPNIFLWPKGGAYSWPSFARIDLLLSRGNRQYSRLNDSKALGVELITSRLLYGLDNAISRTEEAQFNTSEKRSLNRDFHVYEMLWSPENITISVDKQLIGTFATGEGYFRRGEFGAKNNPWMAGGQNAPFDQEFELTVALMVGGTDGWFPDAGVANNVGGKPWLNDAAHPKRDFWNGRSQWLSTWNLDSESELSSSLQLDYVQVFAL